MPSTDPPPPAATEVTVPSAVSAFLILTLKCMPTLLVKIRLLTQRLLLMAKFTCPGNT